MGEPDGPYLALAALCERVIEDKEGVLTLVRVIDRFVVQIAQMGGPPGTGPPQAMPQVPIQTWLVLAFKSGAARGSRRVGIKLRAPSGMKVGQDISMPLFLEGDDRGQNIVLQLSFQTVEEGLYWFDIDIDGDIVTRIPLRILYQPIGFTQPPRL